MTKRLTLKREDLAELTAGSLESVVAGGSVESFHAYTCPLLDGLSRAFACDYLTHNC